MKFQPTKLDYYNYNPLNFFNFGIIHIFFKSKITSFKAFTI